MSRPTPTSTFFNFLPTNLEISFLRPVLSSRDGAFGTPVIIFGTPESGPQGTMKNWPTRVPFAHLRASLASMSEFPRPFQLSRR